jgi:hypothetical protein
MLSYQDFMDESASDIRSFVKTQNNKFTEKGTGLDSGGNLDDKISNIAIAILSRISKDIPDLKVTLTSGNDRFHKNLGSNSKHKMGKAVDFVINPYNAVNLEKVKKILDEFASGNPGFTYLDEYTKPSSASTGGHIHIAYDPQSPEGSHARKTYGKEIVNVNLQKQEEPKTSSYGSSYDKKENFWDYTAKTDNRDTDVLDTWEGFIKRLSKEY